MTAGPPPRAGSGSPRAGRSRRRTDQPPRGADRARDRSARSPRGVGPSPRRVTRLLRGGDRRSRTLVALAAAAAAVAVATLATVAATGPVAGVATTGRAFALTQGDDCTPVAAFGDGTTSVSAFYDYRNASTDPAGRYSSYGPTSLQVHQTSVLFLYNGSRGVSLVLLHDALGDESEGGAMTVTFSGLPEDGTWAVEDDTYPSRDDNFTHEGSTTVVDWMWAPNRTDGAAFRGVDRDGVTVAPDFDAVPKAKNESGEWVDWEYADDPIDGWIAYTGSGAVSLDRTRNATVRRGSCDPAGPTAALSVAPDVADVNVTSVTLDAGNATASAGVERYRWDFDGDGSVDATTGNATVSHVYAARGRYDATVTVVDGQGRTDSANATLTVTDRVAPTARASVPTTAGVNASVAVDATASTDNDAVANVTWRFEDGPTVTGPVANHSYATAGTYDVTLAVTDRAGYTDRLRTNVTVLRPAGNFSRVPTDPDGDGRAEDVNGDGDLTVVDVQALFANREDPVLAEYPHLFDYNADGDVDVVDVQALFAETTDGS